MLVRDQYKIIERVGGICVLMEAIDSTRHRDDFIHGESIP